MFPEHLNKLFCAVYQELYDERKLYDKKDSRNGLLKLALNATYGKSNDKYSCFYDPKFTMTITINGQLSLCMLAEELLKLPTLRMLMLNTDGLTYSIDPEYQHLADEVCKQWEIITKLDLETAYYSKMLIRDVNNYIAVYENGKTKCKGAYEYENLAWHKDHSMLVVPKAVEHAFKNNLGEQGVQDYINNHTDIFDFVLRYKVPKSGGAFTESSLGIKKYIQNTGRYYVAKEGEPLFKELPPVKAQIEVIRMQLDDEVVDLPTTRKTTEKEVAKLEKRGYTNLGVVTVDCENRIQAICSGEKVGICNKISDFNVDNLKKSWYIDKAKKLLTFGEFESSDEQEELSE